MPGVRPPGLVNRPTRDNVSPNEPTREQASREGDFSYRSTFNQTLSPGETITENVFENSSDVTHYVGHANAVMLDNYGHTFLWGVQVRDEDDIQKLRARMNIGNTGFINIDPPWPIHPGEDLRLVLDNQTDNEVTAVATAGTWKDPEE